MSTSKITVLLVLLWLCVPAVVALAIVALCRASSARRQAASLRVELERLRKIMLERTAPPRREEQPAAPKQEQTPASAAPEKGPAPSPASPLPPEHAFAPDGSPVTPVPVPAAKLPAAPLPEPAPANRGEFFVGKIILSVTAAVLVFIGLIYLALDDRDGIPDWVRIGSMFAVAGICLAAGLLMGRKKRDNFNLALTGCGVGALFIAILLTHVWFGYMADWLAFGLLLLWSAAALWLTRRTDSLLLSIIAHIGMLTSICFGYSLGLSDEKLLLLLVYQFASSAVLILGNMLCYRRTYHVGLLASLAMTAVAGGFMWVKFTPRMELDAFLFNSELPIWFIALAFYLQFLAATYLSYLLSVSAARIKNPTTAGLVHAANKLLWLASMGVNFCLTTFNVLVPIVSGGKPYSEVPLHSEIRWKCFLIEAAAAVVIWIVHLIVTDLFRTHLNFPRPLALISTLLGAGGVTLLFFWLNSFTAQCRDVRFNLLMLSVPGLILLGYARVSGERKLRWGAYALLSCDYFGMVSLGSYEYLIRHTGPGGLFYALAYFAVPMAAVLLDFFFSDAENRRRTSVFVRIFALLVTEFSFISICSDISALGEGYHGTAVWFSLNRTLLPLGLCLLLLAVYLFRLDRPTVTPPSEKEALWTPVRGVLLVNEIILLIVCVSVLSSEARVGLELFLQTLLFAAALALAFCRVGEFIRRPAEGFLAVLAGVKLTALVLSFFGGTVDWIESRTAFSVVCMLTALAAIAAGFVIRSKPLRLWGLILTIFCVLKLVTYDMSGSSTLTHIISFIIGGVICFAISAVYTAAEKKLLGKEKENVERP